MIKPEKMIEKAVWTIRKFHGDRDVYDAWMRGEEGNEPYEVSEIEGNVLLNEGIAELHLLLTGGAGTHYGNANAYLGVGNSSTVEQATDTGLLGGSTEFQPMEATYPTYASQVTTWRAVYGSTEANFAWEEYTVVNASSDAGDNLNRKTESEGTKTAGQTWTLDLAITWS